MASLTVTTNSRNTCVQTGCLLKQSGMNADKLAGYLVLMLAGKSPESIAAKTECICPRASCVDCARQVIEGGHAYFSEYEWTHLDNMAQWHRRRVARRNRWWH
jgi:hypothetical protein